MFHRGSPPLCAPFNWFPLKKGIEEQEWIQGYRSTQFPMHSQSLLLKVTESKNDWSGQGLLGPLSSASVPAGTARTRGLGTYPSGCWRSPRRILHSLWAACVNALSLTQHRSASWYSEGIFCVPVVLIASGPGTGHQWEVPDSVLFAPFLQVFVDIGEIPLSFLHAEQPQLFSLFSQERCAPVPSFILVSLCMTFSNVSVSLWYWETQNWTQLSRCAD